MPDTQRQYYDGAIACVSSRLTRYQQVPIELKALIQAQLEALSGLQQKLTQPLLQIAVFGLVSRGKSAVLNALFGNAIFPTGPLNGVTQWPRAVRWSPELAPNSAIASDQSDQLPSSHLSSIHLPKIQLELIDTPGLDEISGESRAVMAQEIADCADLILFVTAGPPMPIEQQALAELAQLAKPLLWVVNKADLYPDLTADSLYQSITDPTLQAILSPREIVLTAAAPAPIQVRHEWPDGRVSLDWEIPVPQVAALQQTLLALLHREGLLLLSLNVLLQAQTLERQIVQAIATFYGEQASATRWRIWSLKAVLVSLSPWVWLDLLLSGLLDIVQVRQLAQHYGFPVTNHRIEGLWKTLALSLGLMGAAEFGTGLDIDGLGIFPGLAGLATQGAIAAYGASLVGRAAQTYLADGATWENQGSSTLIQALLTGLEHTMIIHRLSPVIAQTLDAKP